MKTSNILITSAFLIFFISLGIYNSALKAEYLTGNYKNPLKNFKKLDYTGFNEIDINAAGKLDVSVKSGPEMVYISKEAGPNVKFTLQGKKLIINVAYAKGDDSRRDYTVMITCPKLTEVRTKSWYMDDNKRITLNAEKPDDYNYHNITIEGFKQDSLILEQDNYSVVKMINNKLAYFGSITGVTENCTPVLDIAKSNSVQKANLQMNQKSQLIITNVYISQFSYHFSDSSKVTLSGIALKSLKQ